MKKAALVALIALNAVLVMALVYGATSKPAYGQVIGANFVIVTGEISDDYEAVYILDLSTRRLGAWGYNRQTNRMAPAIKSGIDLKRDFGRN